MTNALNNTGEAGQSHRFQEICISLLDELTQNSPIQSDSVTEYIVNEILRSGQSPEAEWPLSQSVSHQLSYFLS
jgi:hypothetical protein